MPTSSIADPLCERLLRSFPADRAYTAADWNAETMPPPVHHYLDHLLQHHAREEVDRLHGARTEWVNYDHPEMEEAARTFLDAVEEHTQVPATHWEETLRTATRRTTTYLVRPVPTLTSFVFETSPSTIPISQIQWKMRFFGPYAYLRNAVHAFAEKRNHETLEADTFEQVLRRVDERMTADFDADRWVHLLDPLFEMAQHATDRRQIPLSLLRTFFEEKHAPDVVQHLTTHEREKGAEAVSPATLRRLIDTTSTESPSKPHGDSASAPNADFPPPTGPDPLAEERADEAAPMWKQFEQNLSRQSGETETKKQEEAQPLWAQFQNRSPSSSPAPDSTLSSSTRESPPSSSAAPSDGASGPTAGENDLSALEREVFASTTPPKRSVYVENLFQGDLEAYRQILERLRTTESWSTASQIIATDVFQVHQVNIYSDAAVHFTNAVEAGFRE